MNSDLYAVLFASSSNRAKFFLDRVEPNQRVYWRSEPTFAWESYDGATPKHIGECCVGTSPKAAVDAFEQAILQAGSAPAEGLCEYIKHHHSAGLFLVQFKEVLQESGHYARGAKEVFCCGIFTKEEPSPVGILDHYMLEVPNTPRPTLSELLLDGVQALRPKTSVVALMRQDAVIHPELF